MCYRENLGDRKVWESTLWWSPLGAALMPRRHEISAGDSIQSLLEIWSMNIWHGRQGSPSPPAHRGAGRPWNPSPRGSHALPGPECGALDKWLSLLEPPPCSSCRPWCHVWLVGWLRPGEKGFHLPKLQLCSPLGPVGGHSDRRWNGSAQL